MSEEKSLWNSLLTNADKLTSVISVQNRFLYIIDDIEFISLLIPLTFDLCKVQHDFDI